MGFRPTFWPTVFAVPGVLVLLALGSWQVERRYWKESLIAERVGRAEAPPIELALSWTLSGAEAEALAFRRTAAMGRLMHERELYLAARSLNGNAGYHVLTPFSLDDGRTLLVDRGWVPVERKEPAARALGQVEGLLAIEGVIRTRAAQNWLVPDNEPAGNLWFWVDLPAMAAAAGVETEAFYLEAGPAPNPGGFPIGGQTRFELPNDHLQYALTWYALSLALAAIYVIYHLQRSADRSDERLP